ncbi:DNA-binding LacI/PurR family transcriptional regulator [Paenibacillus taihuensis]|uniref:DNA-binding LacI/PurR family transcriptional regulator n=1 Tax=Paenibacillus taihuensis TaxID=1156355 RepID=A0A3D9S9Z0_9BACL|nr:GntR family transcriptional regulator [Paenibacillus taihuensis]REE86403.1 DNA-binding LacI/PurR family transcriptional regulator [Paenibacillus taihuensis]
MSSESTSKPMYEKIFEALREQIIERKYEVGDRVPSEKELGDEYSVSRITSKKALELLANEGFIVRQPGRGSFVAEPQEKPAAKTASGTGQQHHSPRKSGGKLLIGLVITDFADSYGTALIYGMEEASRANDSYLVLRRSFGIPSYEEEAIQGLLELGVDGLIIFPAQGEYFNAEILKLAIMKFPFVLIDRHLKGISAGSISTDNAKAAAQGTNYLFELGHKSIAFLTPPPMDTTAIEERIEGFIQAHAEKGVMVDRELWIEDILSVLPQGNAEENRVRDVEKIAEHLRKHPQITAIFATEYNIAQLAQRAANELGLRVPEDLSIICFDSPEINGAFPLTHMKQNQFDMGRTAFENVLKLRAGETLPNKTLLDATLMLGMSTGPMKPRGR